MLTAPPAKRRGCCPHSACWPTATRSTRCGSNCWASATSWRKTRARRITATTVGSSGIASVGGLPEVIYTGEGNSYLHLPGVIMTESSTGQVQYLLSDGLGSVRQAVDETGAVIA